MFNKTQDFLELSARFYNVTDAAVIGAVQTYYDKDTGLYQHAGGFAEVAFTGAAKTFKLQWCSPDGVSTAGIQDARIEIWRVA